MTRMDGEQAHGPVPGEGPQRQMQRSPAASPLGWTCASMTPRPALGTPATSRSALDSGIASRGIATGRAWDSGAACRAVHAGASGRRAVDPGIATGGAGDAEAAARRATST